MKREGPHDACARLHCARDGRNGDWRLVHRARGGRHFTIQSEPNDRAGHGRRQRERKHRVFKAVRFTEADFITTGARG